MTDSLTPSDKNALIEYRLAKARNTLSEIPALCELGYLSTAINRLYYASFYAVEALMLRHDLRAATHAGVRTMLGLHFIKNGKLSAAMSTFFNEIFTKRHSNDYDDFVVTTREEVNRLYRSAQEFIQAIGRLLDNDN